MTATNAPRDDVPDADEPIAVQVIRFMESREWSVSHINIRARNNFNGWINLDLPIAEAPPKRGVLAKIVKATEEDGYRTCEVWFRPPVSSHASRVLEVRFQGRDVVLEFDHQTFAIVWNMDEFKGRWDWIQKGAYKS